MDDARRPRAAHSTRRISSEATVGAFLDGAAASAADMSSGVAGMIETNHESRDKRRRDATVFLAARSLMVAHDMRLRLPMQSETSSSIPNSISEMRLCLPMQS